MFTDKLFWPICLLLSATLGPLIIADFTDINSRVKKKWLKLKCHVEFKKLQIQRDVGLRSNAHISPYSHHINKHV